MIAMHDPFALATACVRGAIWLAGAILVFRAARILVGQAALRCVAAGMIVTALLTVLGGFRNGGFHLPGWLLTVLFYAPTVSCLLIVGGTASVVVRRVSLRLGRQWVPWRRF